MQKEDKMSPDDTFTEWFDESSGRYVSISVRDVLDQIAFLSRLHPKHIGITAKAIEASMKDRLDSAFQNN
jgi:hypothetical protein